jgi:hypothetical protein
MLYKKNNDDFPGASQHPPSMVAGINARSTRRLEFRIKPTGKRTKERTCPLIGLKRKGERNEDRER